ncbi:hypothetical protein BV20DRAFT_696755 [Pilatotrama ljubarskyi]|nr:hypothetical protein BV20DRAFT_696755 [Pilatotrama ljubarskyi]
MVEQDPPYSALLWICTGILTAGSSVSSLWPMAPCTSRQRAVRSVIVAQSQRQTADRAKCLNCARLLSHSFLHGKGGPGNFPVKHVYPRQFADRTSAARRYWASGARRRAYARLPICGDVCSERPSLSWSCDFLSPAEGLPW